LQSGTTGSFRNKHQLRDLHRFQSQVQILSPRSSRKLKSRRRLRRRLATGFELFWRSRQSERNCGERRIKYDQRNDLEA
jgi:hypothetical protein